MSLLTTPLETPAQETARKLVAGIQGFKRSLLGELRHNMGILWDSPDPQAALDLIGSNAAEVFALNTAFVQFIGGILTQAGDTEGLAELQAIAAKVKPHTVNQDGTVTITPEPEPEE